MEEPVLSKIRELPGFIEGCITASSIKLLNNFFNRLPEGTYCIGELDCVGFGEKNYGLWIVSASGKCKFYEIVLFSNDFAIEVKTPRQTEIPIILITSEGFDTHFVQKKNSLMFLDCVEGMEYPLMFPLSHYLPVKEKLPSLSKLGAILNEEVLNVLKSLFDERGKHLLQDALDKIELLSNINLLDLIKLAIRSFPEEHLEEQKPEIENDFNKFKKDISDLCLDLTTLLCRNSVNQIELKLPISNILFKLDLKNLVSKNSFLQLFDFQAETVGALSPFREIPENQGLLFNASKSILLLINLFVYIKSALLSLKRMAISILILGAKETENNDEKIQIYETAIQLINDALNEQSFLKSKHEYSNLKEWLITCLRNLAISFINKYFRSKNYQDDAPLEEALCCCNKALAQSQESRNGCFLGQAGQIDRQIKKIREIHACYKEAMLLKDQELYNEAKDKFEEIKNILVGEENSIQDMLKHIDTLLKEIENFTKTGGERPVSQRA